MPIITDDAYLNALMTGDFSKIPEDELEARANEIEEADRLATENPNTATRNVKVGLKQAAHSTGGVAASGAELLSRVLDRVQNNPNANNSLFAPAGQENKEALTQSDEELPITAPSEDSYFLKNAEFLNQESRDQYEQVSELAASSDAADI